MGSLFIHIKEFTWRDLIVCGKIIVSYILVFYYKITKKTIIVIADRPNSAEDNGYYLYKWIRENDPSANVYFILSSRSEAFDSSDTHMINWGSISHYAYVIAATVLVDSMFLGTLPNEKFFYLFKHKFLDKKVVYIGHGVHKDSCKTYMYNIHKWSLFTTTIKPEYEYFKQNAGYPDGYIEMTGMPRFDDLLLSRSNNRFILLLPTWRRYIGAAEYKTEKENEIEFLNSDYYKTYKSLITNSSLIEFLNSNKIKLRYCLHPSYRHYTHHFSSNEECIEIVDPNETIHTLLATASMLITDYSSVFFDAAYIGMPIVYYQFDYDEYRKHHFTEGYYDYEKHGYGPVVKEENELVNFIKASFEGNSFKRQYFYTQRSEEHFGCIDTNNCKRTYEAIIRCVKRT